MPARSVAIGGGAELEIADEGSGPAVVLLHGWPVTAYHWRKTVPALLSAGMRAITVELRGLGGRSSGPGPYDKETLAAELIDLLDHLDIPRFALVGHDWGGTVAYLLAADHSHRVRALVVEEELLPGVAVAIPEPGRSQYPSWHGPFNRVPGLGEALVPGREDAYYGTFLRQSAGPRALDDDALATYLDAYRDPSRFATTLAYYRTSAVDTDAVARRSKSRIQVPVLTVGGEFGMGRAVEECFAKVATRVDYRQVDGAGHYPAEQAPDVFNTALVAFLRDVGGT